MRYDNMSAFIVMDIVREAAKYPNAIHFEIGQPDLPPSDKVKAALQNAVQNNQLHRKPWASGVTRKNCGVL